MAEKEFALSDLLLELLPRIAFLDAALTEVDSLLVDILLDISEKVLNIFVNAFK